MLGSRRVPPPFSSTPSSCSLALPFLGTSFASASRTCVYRTILTKTSRSHVWETYLLALLLSVLTVFPPAYTIGSPRDSVVTWLTWVRLFAEFSFVFLLHVSCIHSNTAL